MSLWRLGHMLDAGGTISPSVRASMVTFDPVPTFTICDSRRSWPGVERLKPSFVAAREPRDLHSRRIPVPQGEYRRLLYFWLQDTDNNLLRGEVIGGRSVLEGWQ